LTVFESNQRTITNQLQHSYEEWKKSKEATSQAVGANYVENKDKVKVTVDLK
jgi:hypothetical protein